MPSRFVERLLAMAGEAGAPVSEALAQKLETYYQLLIAWNEKINLSGLDVAAAGDSTLDRLLIEPLLAARHAPAPTTSMVDIGSGGGSPAIPLALTLPGVNLLLVESKARKSVFLKEAIRAVDLANATVVTTRADQLLTDASLREAHELITVRAVRITAAEWAVAQHLLRPGGRLLLFRSASRPAYHGNLPQPWKLAGTFPLVSSNNSWLDVLERPG